MTLVTSVKHYIVQHLAHFVVDNITYGEMNGHESCGL